MTETQKKQKVTIHRILNKFFGKEQVEYYKEGLFCFPFGKIAIDTNRWLFSPELGLMTENKWIGAIILYHQLSEKVRFVVTQGHYEVYISDGTSVGTIFPIDITKMAITEKISEEQAKLR